MPGRYAAVYRVPLASVDTSKREAWYARQVKDGVQVVICHPMLVETGLDSLYVPTIIFYESWLLSAPYGKPAAGRGGSGNDGRCV
jgi:hypothetical protein